MGEIKQVLLSMELQYVGIGGDAPWLVSVHGSTCRVKQRKEIEKSVYTEGNNVDIQY